MMTTKELGAIVKIKREQLGLTQAELGQMLGVAPNTVSAWERGSSGMLNENLFDLRATFGAAEIPEQVQGPLRVAVAKLSRTNPRWSKLQTSPVQPAQPVQATQIERVIEKNERSHTGWICARCSRANAPHVNHCDCR